MSSRQRNIRKKATLSFDDEEGEGQEDEGPAALPPAAKAAQQKQRAKEKSALLSFGDDAAGDAGPGLGGKPKAGAAGSKPKASLRAPGTGAPPPALDDRAARVYTQVSSAGEYTAERLKELQKNARSLPANSKPAYTPAGPAGGGFKLSGSFKPAAPPKDDRFQYNVSAAAVVQPGGPRKRSEDMPLPPPSAPPPPEAPGEGGAPPPPPPPAGGQHGGGRGEEEDGDEDDIPDEEMIAWAKAKRERLRGAHLAPDYIPTASAPPGLSRLRDKKKAEEEIALAPEEGSSGEEDEEDELRMKFVGGAPGAGAAAKAGRGERCGRRDRPAAAAGAEEEGEEEDEEWAQEQIRKGMGGLLAPGARGGSSAALAADGEQAAGAQGGGGAARGAAAAAAFAAGGSQAAAIQAAADEAVRTLQAGLHRLQMSRQQAEKNLQRTTGNLESSLANISRMEGELGAASAKYAFIQGLRAYVADLCNMLQDKSPLVEELEDALLELCRSRAAARDSARAANDAEELAPAEAAAAAATAVLSRGGGAPAAAQAAEAAAQAAEERLLGRELPVELDEFGRDVNAERKAELAARAKQRQARLAALERRFEEQHAAAAAAAEPRLGDDTTDESEGEVSHFRARQKEVQEAADAVFRDADDEFGSLPAVKKRLEEWKGRQPGAYRDAYVSMSAPALFAPFVRLELLKWAPLHGGEPGFDGHQWYQQLFDYGMPQDPSLLDPDDPDANLVPQLVQKLVLPLARQLLSEVWSPLSRRQSRAAAAMLADLLVYVPPDEEAIQELVSLVQSKLEAAVEGLGLPAWPPAALAASRRAALHAGRRFGRGVRLLAAACAFDGSLPRAALQRLALDKLVGAQLLPYARSAAGNPALAADRLGRIVAALPAEWFRPSGPPPRGGEGIMEVLAMLARTLEAQAPGGSAAGGGGAATAAGLAEAARQVAAALHKMGDASRANKLSKAYGVL